MALLNSALRTTMIFQLVLASYLLDTVYSAGAGGSCLSGNECDKATPDLICEAAICKLKNGSDCSSAETHCVAGASCTNTSPRLCVCLTAATPNRTCTAATTTPLASGAVTTTSAPNPAAVTTTTAPHLGLVNDACSKNGTIPGGCVNHTLCIVGTCVCEEGYHRKTSRRCGIIVQDTPNISCQEDEDCVDHANCSTTAQSIKACKCDSYHIKTSNGTCALRVPAGSLCDNVGTDTQQGNCIPNAVCNHVCECNNNYYKNESSHCVQRIKPGQPCEESENNCIEGAECLNHFCQCLRYSHILASTGDQCNEIIQVGKDCSDNKVCEENAHCNTTHRCMCNDDFFYNDIVKHCDSRKLLGEVCSHDEECVQNANCSHGTCQCKDNYYNQQQRCYPRLPQNHQCDSSVPRQCLVHGECVNEICQCDRNSYDTGSDCHLTLHFGDECDLEVSDPRQCESNTTCGFHQGEGNTRCGCDVNHFFNGEYCVKRAAAGDSCPYASNSSLGLAIPYNEFLRQCVQNAECNEPLQVCECSPGFYDRNGRCPTQIAPDHACDPWTNFPHQCAGNYQCLYGRCVPQH